jgi:hypothetical protein
MKNQIRRCGVNCNQPAPFVTDTIGTGDNGGRMFSVAAFNHRLMGSTADDWQLRARCLRSRDSPIRIAELMLDTLAEAPA